jgi:hypothetical protein
LLRKNLFFFGFYIFVEDMAEEVLQSTTTNVSNEEEEEEENKGKNSCVSFIHVIN